VSGEGVLELPKGLMGLYLASLVHHLGRAVSGIASANDGYDGSKRLEEALGVIFSEVFGSSSVILDGKGNVVVPVIHEDSLAFVVFSTSSDKAAYRIVTDGDEVASWKAEFVRRGVPLKPLLRVRP